MHEVCIPLRIGKDERQNKNSKSSRKSGRKANSAKVLATEIDYFNIL